MGDLLIVKGAMTKSVTKETKSTSQGRGVYRAGKGKGKGINRAGEGVLRAGYGRPLSSASQNNNEIDF